MALAHAPAGSLLYSLLHLGGFAGDLRFYSSRCSGSSRILELGCGDGRVAAAVVLGEGSLTMLQQHQERLSRMVPLRFRWRSSSARWMPCGT